MPRVLDREPSLSQRSRDWKKPLVLWNLAAHTTHDSAHNHTNHYVTTMVNTTIGDHSCCYVDGQLFEVEHYCSNSRAGTKTVHKLACTFRCRMRCGNLVQLDSVTHSSSCGEDTERPRQVFACQRLAQLVLSIMQQGTSRESRGHWQRDGRSAQRRRATEGQTMPCVLSSRHHMRPLPRPGQSHLLW